MGVRFTKWRIVFQVITVITIIIGFGFIDVYHIQTNPDSVVQAETNRKLFLPLIKNGGVVSTTKILGLTQQAYWGPNSDGQANIDRLIKGADTWAGKKHSMISWFIGWEEANPDYNFVGQLETLWKNGYVSFVNVSTNSTMFNVAKGDIDANIRNMARSYAAWLNQGGGRMAYLAPFQEMNGYWTVYGKDPGNFKIAYDRVRRIFSEEGVPSSSVRWVFAPNGLSEEGHEFENYYPGQDKVDAVAFSSYNYGFCPVADPWPRWEQGKDIYDPYIKRIQAMAPGKPIILAQMGTTAQYPQSGVYDYSMKNQWLIDTYAYFASQPDVFAIIYYDMDLSWECDWAVYNTSLTRSSGYKIAVSSSSYSYLSPSSISGLSMQSTP